MQDHVKFPVNFGRRDCDRLLSYAIQDADHTREEAFHFLWNIWMDFAMARTDRRNIGHLPVESSPHTRILEEYCGWKGRSGELVTLAIESGFMALEESEDTFWLVCTDFFPLNEELDVNRISAQKKGAYVRHARRAIKEGDAMAGDLFKIMEIRGQKGLLDKFPEESRRHCVSIITSISRVLGLPSVTEGVLNDECLSMSYDIICHHDPDTIERVFMWLMANRAESSIPKREDLILRNFKSYIEKSQ